VSHARILKPAFTQRVKTSKPILINTLLTSTITQHPLRTDHGLVELPVCLRGLAFLISWAAVNRSVALMTLALILKTRFTALSVMVLACVTSLPAAAQSLDYDVFKTKVEPIFLQKRPSHARCVVCHAAANHAFSLQPLDKGATTWTEEQSRKNFEMVSRIVRPGNPDASLLLRQPLAHEAGGQEFHSGGRQFATKDDPAWKTMADWVRAAK